MRVRRASRQGEPKLILLASHVRYKLVQGERESRSKTFAPHFRFDLIYEARRRIRICDSNQNWESMSNRRQFVLWGGSGGGGGGGCGNLSGTICFGAVANVRAWISDARNWTACRRTFETSACQKSIHCEIGTLKGDRLTFRERYASTISLSLET